MRRLKAAQAKCAHKWGDAYQDYDEERVPIQENRPMGSDYFNPVTTGWKSKRIPVWRRKCAECGAKQTMSNGGTIEADGPPEKPRNALEAIVNYEADLVDFTATINYNLRQLARLSGVSYAKLSDFRLGRQQLKPEDAAKVRTGPCLAK